MEYTLDALVAGVASRLAAQGLDRQDNGRVSAVPDARTLRYYTTLGLMDRPDAVRDRRAIYGDRHVVQAVAVKRLQTEGWSLAAIQERLAGLPDDQIEAIASGSRRAARGFWADAPAPPLAEPAPYGDAPAPRVAAAATGVAAPAPRVAAPAPGVAAAGARSPDGSTSRPAGPDDAPRPDGPFSDPSRVDSLRALGAVGALGALGALGRGRPGGPLDAPSPAGPLSAPSRSGGRLHRGRAPGTAADRGELMVALPLAEGVTLLLATDAIPDAGQIAAIRTAAGSLLDLLTSRSRPSVERADPSQRTLP